MHFVGSDIRNYNYIFWKEKNIVQFLSGEIQFTETLKWQDLLIKKAVKYADTLLVSTPDLLDIIPKARYFPVLIDFKNFNKELERIKVAQKTKGEIVILHAPSNASTKGTEIIRQVLAKIQKESGQKIKIILPDKTEKTNWSHSFSRYELFKYLKEADIVIDQLIIGWYGLQAIEALLADNLVISYIDNKLENYLYPNSPIVNANALNLEEMVYASIDRILNNEIDYKKNKEWVQKYHTIESNNIELKQALEIVS